MLIYYLNTTNSSYFSVNANRTRIMSFLYLISLTITLKVVHNVLFFNPQWSFKTKKCYWTNTRASYIPCPSRGPWCRVPVVTAAPSPRSSPRCASRRSTTGPPILSVLEQQHSMHVNICPSLMCIFRVRFNTKAFNMIGVFQVCPVCALIIFRL